MVFFQAALLVGYLYAHLASRLPPRAQLGLHAVLFAAAVPFLPLRLDPSLGQPAAGGTALRLLLALVRRGRRSRAGRLEHRPAAPGVVLEDRQARRRGPVLPVRREQRGQPRGAARLPVADRAPAGVAAPGLGLERRIPAARGVDLPLRQDALVRPRRRERGSRRAERSGCAVTEPPGAVAAAGVRPLEPAAGRRRRT